MLFVFLLANSLSVKALEELPEATPVPISVHVELMDKNSEKCANDDGIECTESGPSNCGNTCQASTTDHYFQYVFKGEKFQIYATKKNDYGKFSLLLDGSPLIEVDTHSETTELRTLVFTSDNLNYREHTIRVEGLGNSFEIYKFAFWPSLKAKRLNFSDNDQNFGNWQKQSDLIGGSYITTNQEDATSAANLPCSKIWLYGIKIYEYGSIKVTFNGVEKVINEHTDNMDELALLYESDEYPFKMYQLSIANAKTTNLQISLYCVYYLHDPPIQTPAPYPSRTIYPNTATDYINKEFTNTLENGNIAINSDSQVSQISGCTFTNIDMTGQSDPNFFGYLKKQVVFYDNTFTFTEDFYASGKQNPTIFWFSELCTRIHVTSCTFNNFRYIKQTNEGIIMSANDYDFEYIFESCTFTNNGNELQSKMFKMNHRGVFRVIKCTFSFDNNNYGTILCTFNFPNIYFDQNTFIRPPNSFIKIDVTENPDGDPFTFTNNIVKQNNKGFMHLSDLQRMPIIQNNVFEEIDLTNGYLISIIHKVTEIEIVNNTFSHITTSSGKYCGGISSWYQNKDHNDMTILYDQCKFYDISNKNTEDPFNQGGAIQQGHSTSIYNAAMTFSNCEFKRNKCENGMGGALGININKPLTIDRCIFEDNSASKGGAIYFWAKFAKPSDNSQAPEPSDVVQISIITITNCQFIGNKAPDGSAIYIEEEKMETVKLDISSCNFINNGEGYSSNFMIVSYNGEVDFDNNTVEFTDVSKAVCAASFRKANTLTLSSSTFKNCYTDSDSTIEFAENNENSVSSITNCQFINCYDFRYVVKNANGIVNVESSTWSFDNSDSACGAIDCGNKGFSVQHSHFIKTRASGAIKIYQFDGEDPIVISNCIFDGCTGTNKKCADIMFTTAQVTFSHNIFRNMVATDHDGYIISFERFDYDGTMTFVVENVTFIDNTCNSWYGGGSGLWIAKVGPVKFNDCKFINNIALESEVGRTDQQHDSTYKSGDGGGLQFGFTQSTFKSNLEFNSCEFRNNKAVRHGGALAIQTVGTVKINDCIFEGNVANYKQGSSKLLDYPNYYDRKTDGRGGSIYINPAFYHEQMGDFSLHMIDVAITTCTFTNNDAYDGYGIYIEGSDPGTEFTIEGNTFNDNHDDTSKSMVVSEIKSLTEKTDIAGQNTFNYKDQEVVIPPVVIVDNSAQPPSKTQTPTTEPKTPTTEPKTPTSEPKTPTSKPKTPNPDVPTGGDSDDDIFEIINATSKGRHEYIYTDYETSYLIVVSISRFYDIHSRKEGGAIHIKNAGIICNNTDFENCTSEVSGGGIYLKNEFDNVNEVILLYNNFTQCKALYGGGIYIYSSNRLNRVQIRLCTFYLNEATAKKADGGKYGGSGIYSTIRNGKINDCTFFDVPCEGSSLKLDNSMSSRRSNSLKLLDTDKEKKSFIVSDCNFNFMQDDAPSCGVFFVRGKSDVLVQLEGCKFNGKLANDSRYIDGVVVSNDSPKMIVKNCQFENGKSSLVILDSDFMSINEEFSSKVEQKDKHKKSALAVVVSTAFLVAALATVGLVLFALRRKKNTLSEENEMQLEASSSEVENGI